MSAAVDGDSARGAFAALCATLATDALSLAIPLLLWHAIDDWLPRGATPDPTELAAALVAVVALDLALRLSRGAIAAWSAARQQHGVRRLLTERLLGARLTSVQRLAPGVVAHAFAGVETMARATAERAAPELAAGLSVVLFLAATAAVGGLVVIAPAVLIVLCGAAALPAGLAVRRAAAAQAAMAARTDGRAGRNTTRWHELAAEALMWAGLRAGWTRALADVLPPLTLIAALGLGVLLVPGGGLTLGAVAAASLLAAAATRPVAEALRALPVAQAARVAQARTAAILDLPPEAPGALPALPPLDGAVDLRGVAWIPPGAVTPLLHDVDLAIPAGDTVGLEGGIASGKTTLLLLAGLLRPQEGVIRLDGHDLAEVEPASVRDQVAWIAQEPTLFRGTLYDNLTGYRAGAVGDEALALAHLLGLDDRIKRLPHGWDTPADTALPPGLKQLLALARALAGAPRLVLVDDALAGLDPAGQARALRLFEELRGKATLVLASRRPELPALADRRFHLSEGTLVPGPAPDYRRARP